MFCSHLVTFEWLKSSSRIGEWLRVKKFEPKTIFHSNPSLNIYRKFRHQQKPIELFNQCGLIYLTSLVTQRSLLLKLISLLGGNVSCTKKRNPTRTISFLWKVTISRDRAKIIVGRSSKVLQIIIHPQVNEQWIIGWFLFEFVCVCLIYFDWFRFYQSRQMSPNRQLSHWHWLKSIEFKIDSFVFIVFQYLSLADLTCIMNILKEKRINQYLKILFLVMKEGELFNENECFLFSFAKNISRACRIQIIPSCSFFPHSLSMTISCVFFLSLFRVQYYRSLTGLSASVLFYSFFFVPDKWWKLCHNFYRTMADTLNIRSQFDHSIVNVIIHFSSSLIQLACALALLGLQITLTVTETCAFRLGVGFWSFPFFFLSSISIWILLWKRNSLCYFLAFILHIFATLFATTIILIGFLALIDQLGSVCSTSSRSKTYFLSINISLMIVSFALKFFLYLEMLLLYFIQRQSNDLSILTDKNIPGRNYQIRNDWKDVDIWIRRVLSMNECLLFWPGESWWWSRLNEWMQWDRSTGSFFFFGKKIFYLNEK